MQTADARLERYSPEAKLDGFKVALYADARLQRSRQWRSRTCDGKRAAAPELVGVEENICEVGCRTIVLDQVFGIRGEPDGVGFPT
jgi:hypothetical protein